MPGLDGTGPRGRGAMTGGRRGYCAGFAGGAGRGFRHQYRATGLTGWQRAQMDAAPARESRTGQIAELEARLDEALARLARLEGNA